MSYSLATLTTALTADEVEAAIYDAVEARGAKTSAWKPGAVVRTIIAGVSIVLAAFSSLIALVAAGGFLELATGDWLTLVARYVFGVERIGATFATGTVTLTNGSGTPYSGGADDLIVQNSTTDAVYRSTGAWSVAAGPGATADVEVKATIRSDGRTIHKRGYETFLFRRVGEAWKVVHTHSSTRSVATVAADEHGDHDHR